MRRTLAIIIVIAALAVTSACVPDGNGGSTFGLPTGVVYPKIVPDDSMTEDPTVNYTFTFESTQRTLTVAVDGAVYAGADAAQKSVTRFGDARENDWIEDYYPVFVNEPHQDAFYDDLLGQLRAIKSAEGLDRDRYAELLTVFVQSIEYRSDPVDLSPKFPIETFVEQSGDCDDKTLLLAGLLSREGYDVAVLLFESEQHVALGIRSDTNDYKNTGYAFTETTSPGFIGMVSDDLGGGIVLASKPRVFRIDGGTTAFTAGQQVAFIVERDAQLEQQTVELGESVKAADTELATLENRVSSLKTQLAAYSAVGDTARYNALVPEYNRAVDAYNTKAAERNSLADRYNDAVAARTYIYDHLDDRPAVYRFLRG
ncbi:MAG: hypothetical protein U1F44_01075 [Coriobacteriia bacterium]|nr:hypothetical protein [Coriobacteriia bacterium]